MTRDMRAYIRERVTISLNGCWIWGRAVTGAGYAKARIGGRYRDMHRVSYEAFVGPIAAGLVIDHLCRNPVCVNPSHLEPVTIRENLRRGETSFGRVDKTGKCRRGHVYDEANTYVWRGGSKRCRACGRSNQRRYYRKKILEVVR